MEQEIFGVTRAAKYCAVSRGTLWKHIKSGALKASMTPGGHYRIVKRDLDAFAREKGMYPLGSYQPEEKKILIVDDDPEIRDLFETFLSAEGYKIETASDGFEAGVKVTKFNPSLIILDLFMPGMDGFEVCRRIRADPANRDTKILVITGYDSKESRQQSMEAGADDYLAKPGAKDTLIAHAAALLNHGEGAERMRG